MEFWYGPAVLSQRPGPRVLQAERENLKLIRAAKPTLNSIAHTATTRYEIWAIRDRQLIDHFVEDHCVRFFFPLELALFFELVGMELVALHAFPDLEREPTDDDWNAAVVASAGRL
jgi:hypothetical protein